MNTQPDSHEWETLSAYLDDALSPAEKQRLEARLQTSPELRQILHELRLTRILLHNVPQRRAPRNFTLTEQMVRTRPQKLAAWLIPTFSISSALATLMLVVSLFVEMFASPAISAPMQLVAAPSAAQPEAEMGASLALEPTEPPMIITWSHPGMGGGGGMDMPYGMVAEGKGGGEPAPLMIMEAPVGEAEAKQAPIEESAATSAESAADQAVSPEEDSSLRMEKEQYAEEAAPMLPEQAAEALPMPEATIPAVEPTPTPAEDYTESALAAPPSEELLPTEIPVMATAETAQEFTPTAAPRIYEEEELPFEAQPPLIHETPEETPKSSDTDEVIIFGLPAPDEAGKIIPPESAMAKGMVDEAVTADQTAPEQPFNWSLLRLALLFIAALSGGFAFILHRKRS